MITQQWHAATTACHSYIHTCASVPYWSPDVWLVLYRVASRYSVWTLYVTESGRGSPTFFGQNPPFWISKSATVNTSTPAASWVYHHSIHMHGMQSQFNNICMLFKIYWISISFVDWLDSCQWKKSHESTPTKIISFFCDPQKSLLYLWQGQLQPCSSKSMFLFQWL